MNKILIGLLLLIIIGCSLSKFVSDKLPEEEILKHVNFVLEELQNQGFNGVIGKVKERKIYLPVKINGVSDELLLDTGSTYTFINYDHIPKYHLKKIKANVKNANIQTLFGNISDYERAVADEFKIGGYKFSPWPFIVTKGSHKPILGTDFLHYTNAVIICRYSILLFNVNQKKAENMADSLKKIGYSEINLTLSGGRGLNKIAYKNGENTYELEIGTFMAKGNFNGINGIILIDTGSLYTSIDHNLAIMTGRKIKKQNKIYFTDAVGNISYPSIIFADSLKIDNYLLSVKRFFPIFEDLNRNTSSYELPFLGIIGIDYLVQNNAIIDFGNRKLYLIK
ncbi:MAG: hypothetical protein GXO77_15745 [Calditrichaeota bacterium]|nr:hypothetical protein [Calditrichota bacterium]